MIQDDLDSKLLHTTIAITLEIPLQGDHVLVLFFFLYNSPIYWEKLLDIMNILTKSVSNREERDIDSDVWYSIIL